MPVAPPSDAPNPPDPHQDRLIPIAGRPGCARLLLGLVRKLVDYGKSLTGALQRTDAAATNPSVIMMGFGTRDLALIAARITRGLMLAVALEARLLCRVAREDKRPSAPAQTLTSEPPPPACVRDRSPRKPRATRPVDDPTSLLARMPTAEEIAEQIRRRPIGAVIADICADLGIVASHPLWRDLRDAISFNGGSFIRFMRELFDRPRLLDSQPPDMPWPIPPGWPPPPPDPWFAEAMGTGPP